MSPESNENRASTMCGFFLESTDWQKVDTAFSRVARGNGCVI
jgi:hypothetical protein